MKCHPQIRNKSCRNTFMTMKKVSIFIMISIPSFTQCFLHTKQKLMIRPLRGHPRKIQMNILRFKDDPVAGTVAETSERINNTNGLAENNTALTSRRKHRKQDFPPQVYNMDKLPDDSKTPFFFPELKAMDYLRSSRLVLGRSYARKESFVSVDKEFKPTVQDLSSPPSTFIDRFLISSWYRLAVFGLTWQIYPYIKDFLIDKGDLLPSDLLVNISPFVSGLSLIYGAFVSLTLSILYNRQKNVLDQIESETSLIAVVTQNIMTIFEDDDDRLVEAGQCIADQIRILVMESRGHELMTIIYSDPYIRILNLLSENQRKTDTSESLIGWTRDLMKDMFQLRGKRLGAESLSLPPIHFVIFAILTAVTLLGFSLSTLNNGAPANETRFLFSTFVTVYVIFYRFALDLNNPFNGAYQIRRSGPAAHLLQSKMILWSNPLLKSQISFDK